MFDPAEIQAYVGLNMSIRNSVQDEGTVNVFFSSHRHQRRAAIEFHPDGKICMVMSGEGEIHSVDWESSVEALDRHTADLIRFMKVRDE